VESEEIVLYRVDLLEHGSVDNAEIQECKKMQISCVRFLEIVYYKGDDGFILLLNDENNEWINDMFQPTLDAVFAYAKRRFGIEKSDWKEAEHP